MKKLLQLGVAMAMLTTCVIPAGANWSNLFGGGSNIIYGGMDFDNLTEAEQSTLYDRYTQGDTTELEIDTAFLEGTSDWAEEEIFYAYCEGLLDGSDSILCDYQSPITRLEFCQLVVSTYKSMGGQSISTINPFTDTVNPDVVTAYALGIVKGTSDTTFSPDETISRQDLAVMMYRVIKIFVVPQISNDISVYADADEIADYALDAVTYMNQIGAMNGYSTTEMAPGEKVTREESILIAYRAVESFL